MQTLDTPDLDSIRKAADRIRGHAHLTPILTSSAIDELLGCSLFFKCENLQKIGAFKFRGALNAVMSLDDDTAKGGIVTHSSGNHGAAIALAARIRGIDAHVVMPASANVAKKRAVAAYGATIVECGPTLADRDQRLTQLVEQLGAHVIHPFNDSRVIAGQGTAALELLDQVPDLDVVVTPIGGGGLIGGTALTVAGLTPEARVIGCEPAAADDAYRSFRAGRIVPIDTPQTIADGLKATLGPLTFAIIREHVNDVALTSEPGIVEAMRLIWERMKIIVEPSSAVALAGLRENELGLTGKRIGLIISGGNVDLDALPW